MGVEKSGDERGREKPLNFPLAPHWGFRRSPKRFSTLKLITPSRWTENLSKGGKKKKDFSSGYLEHNHFSSPNVRPHPLSVLKCPVREAVG